MQNPLTLGAGRPAALLALFYFRGTMLAGEMSASLSAAQRRAAEHRLAERRRAPPEPCHTPLVWVAAACGVGLIASWGWPLRFEWTGVFSVLLLVGWLIAWRRRHDTWACGLLLAAVAAIAAGRADADWTIFPADELGRHARLDPTPVCLEGVVCSLPTHYPAEPPSPYRAIPSSDRTKLRLRATRLRDGQAWREVSGECELTIFDSTSKVTAGDRVRVFGQLRTPRPAGSPGERAEESRARAERQLATVWAEAPECVTPIATPAPTTTTLSATRLWAREQLDRCAPGESGSLLRALILGDTSRLSQETVEAFRRTGAMHLLVVSGLHVGLAVAVLPALATLGLLPRRGAWVAALLLALAYVAMVGGRPPAVRAGVVAGAACLAALAGRRPLSANSLAGGAIAVFATTPAAWLGVGTQLSFLAAATLLGVSLAAERRRAGVKPPLERLIQSARPWPARQTRRLASWGAWAVTATASVQLVTAPLVASSFHLLSPAASPLTLIVSPLIGVIVASGLATLALQAFGLTMLGQLTGGLAGHAAEKLVWLIEHVADSPLAAVWVAGPTPWWTVAWCAGGAAVGAAWVYQLAARAIALRTALALGAAWFAPVLWESATTADELRVTFIAVGHGSATLLEPPDGGAVLVDAGAIGSPERATDVIARALWSRAISRLDAVVLTHPDLDHYNALPGLLERFRLDSVWTTTRMFPRWDDPLDRSGPAALSRLLRDHGIPIRTVETGDILRIGSAKAIVLHPDRVGIIGSNNANSLVLGVEHAGHRVLLPGDLESPGLEAVLSQEPYDCDLLLAPHHGSRLSNPVGFADWCRPEAVVISSAQPADEASAAYRAAGATIWPTRNRGAITGRVSAAGIRLSGYRKPGSWP